MLGAINKSPQLRKPVQDRNRYVISSFAGLAKMNGS